MKFIITNDRNLQDAKNELIVVIDVLRAFTTACYAMNNGPKDYVVIKDVELALKLKKENLEYILIGERMGIKLPGFDHDNSPAEIKDINLLNKTVIQNTTLGTKGIVNALNHTDNVITGSFVNAKAIVNYIRKEKPSLVYLFPTDDSSDDNEDAMLAKYIKSHFESKELSIDFIKKHIASCKTGKFYANKANIKNADRDLPMAFEANKFNFILKAYKTPDGLIHLKKIIQ